MQDGEWGAGDGPALTAGEIERILAERMGQLRAYVRVRAGRALRALEPVSDLVQSALREMVEQAPRRRFPSEVAFVRWIHQVAMNKIISKSRRHAAGRRDAARLEELASRVFEVAPPSVSTLGASPSVHVARREDLELLRAALAELDPLDSEIVCLRHFFDLTTPKIALTLGMPESTVRWHLARAKTKLADRLR